MHPYSYITMSYKSFMKLYLMLNRGAQKESVSVKKLQNFKVVKVSLFACVSVSVRRMGCSICECVCVRERVCMCVCARAFGVMKGSPGLFPSTVNSEMGDRHGLF